MTQAWAHLCRWWIDEIRELGPAWLADWALGRSVDDVVITPDGAGVRIERATRRGRYVIGDLPWATYTAGALHTLRARHASPRTRIVLNLPPGRFFERCFAAPVQARAYLERLATQDLERRTPFRADDIYHDYTVEPGPAVGKLVVRQSVIRREFVIAELERLGLDLGILGAVGCERSGMRRAAIALTPRRGASLSAVGRCCAAMAGAAVILLAVVLGANWWAQSSRIEALEADIAVSKAGAHAVSAMADRLGADQATQARLRSRKALDPRLLDVWEEVSRILPDDTWLTELRVSDDPTETASADRVVTMTGFSTASAQLVGLLDRSPILADARLTAPILFDPAEERERFVLEARLHRKASSAAAPPSQPATTTLVSR